VGGQVCDQLLQESRRATHVDRDRHGGLDQVQRDTRLGAYPLAWLALLGEGGVHDQTKLGFRLR
jgi:hypothetical protein